MKKLNAIGAKYGTDKGDSGHTFKDQNYLDIYHEYVKSFRQEAFNFLEIGVRDGASMRMWSDYFPNATIIGLDIDPSCKDVEKGRDNINIEIGSQEDEEFLNEIIEKYKSFKVILDDGSHINTMIMKSFNVLNKYVENFYIIEDLANSYINLNDHNVLSWPGMSQNKNLQADNSVSRPAFNKMMFDLIKELDGRRSDWRAFHFHAQILVLEK
jgi:hypothetical protein